MNGPRTTIRTLGAAQTRAVAAALAPLLGAGDLVGLSGDLGAGKTCFVQGAAAALGVAGRVTSPTFTIMRSYRGRLPIVHLDVYRLDRLQDVLELGEEAVDAADAVTFVEWGDAVETLLPADRLDIVIESGRGEDERTLLLEPHGSWVGRWRDVENALAPLGSEPAEARY